MPSPSLLPEPSRLRVSSEVRPAFRPQTGKDALGPARPGPARLEAPTSGPTKPARPTACPAPSQAPQPRSPLPPAGPSPPAALGPAQAAHRSGSAAQRPEGPRPPGSHRARPGKRRRHRRAAAAARLAQTWLLAALPRSEPLLLRSYRGRGHQRAEGSGHPRAERRSRPVTPPPTALPGGASTRRGRPDPARRRCAAGSAPARGSVAGQSFSVQTIDSVFSKQKVLVSLPCSLLPKELRPVPHSPQSVTR